MSVPDVFTCPEASYNGFHCEHWSCSSQPCCHCGSTLDSDDDRCPR